MKWIYIFIIAIFLFNSQAQPRKRYKQRNHKLQTNAYFHLEDDKKISGMLNVSYAKNWGYFEIGGLLGLNPSRLELKKFLSTEWNPELAIFAEGNLFKNKRKQNWIPSLGLKISYMIPNNKVVYLSPYFVSKWFISYRTSLHLALEYPIGVGWKNRLGIEWWNGVKILWGYAYYFH